MFDFLTWDQLMAMPDEEEGPMSNDKETGNAKNYGKLYWCVECDNEIIRLMADRVEITQAGVLVFWTARPEGDFINFAFGAGKWIHVFAASVIDGGAISVEHWDKKVSKPNVKR